MEFKISFYYFHDLLVSILVYDLLYKYVLNGSISIYTDYITFENSNTFNSNDHRLDMMPSTLMDYY